MQGLPREVPRAQRVAQRHKAKSQQQNTRPGVIGRVSERDGYVAVSFESLTVSFTCGIANKTISAVVVSVRKPAEGEELQVSLTQLRNVKSCGFWLGLRGRGHTRAREDFGSLSTHVTRTAMLYSEHYFGTGLPCWGLD